MNKEPRKIALIHWADYPRKDYSVYWEIRVDGNETDGYEYGVRLYSYDTHRIVQQTMGDGDTRNTVDTLAQQWVIDTMPTYRR